jgi:hypothetical protein
MFSVHLYFLLLYFPPFSFSFSLYSSPLIFRFLLISFIPICSLLSFFSLFVCWFVYLLSIEISSFPFAGLRIPAEDNENSVILVFQSRAPSIWCYTDLCGMSMLPVQCNVSRNFIVNRVELSARHMKTKSYRHITAFDLEFHFINKQDG